MTDHDSLAREKAKQQERCRQSRAEYTPIAQKLAKTLVDTIGRPGYYGEGVFRLFAADGVITHAEVGQNKTHKAR